MKVQVMPLLQLQTHSLLFCGLEGLNLALIDFQIFS